MQYGDRTASPPPQKDLIVLDDIHRAFAVDALTSSHPLSSKEDSIFLPEQISEQFDTIAYSKVLAPTTQMHQQYYNKDKSSWYCIYTPVFMYVLYECLTPQGAAVLRMVSDFLSEPVFVQGLSVCRYNLVADKLLFLILF